MAFPTGWGYSQKINIDNTKVSANLTDYPLLVTRDHLHDDVVDPSGSNNAQTDGGDVRFSSDSAGNTQLACEVVTFAHDSTTGAADAAIEIHVKVPSVSSTVDTDVYIWYNTTGTDTQPAVTDTYGRDNTWANFDAVWHLEEGSGSAVDSTGNGYTGTFAGSLPTQTAAQIGNGQDFDGNGDYISIAQSFGTLFDGAADYEIECWADINAGGNDFVLFHPRADADIAMMYRGSSGNGWAFNYYDGSTREVSVGSTATGSVLYHVRGTWDADGNLELFVDDATQGTPLTTGTPNNPGATNLIGMQTTPNNLAHNGLIDELRVHNVLRSTAFRSAGYSNQNSPSTFASSNTPVASAGGVTGALVAAIDTTAAFGAVATAGAAMVSGLSVTDSDAGAGVTVASLAEGATLSAAQAALAQAVAAINAGLTAGETWAASVQAVADLASSVQFGDTQTGATTGALTGDLVTGTTASEDFAAAVQAIADLTEGISVGELITAQGAANASIVAAVSLGATFTGSAVEALTGALLAGTTASEAFVASVQALAALTAGSTLDAAVVAQAAASASIAAGVTLGATFSYEGIVGCLIAAITIAAAVNGTTEITTAADGTITIDPAVDGTVTICP